MKQTVVRARLWGLSVSISLPLPPFPLLAVAGGPQTVLVSAVGTITDWQKSPLFPEAKFAQRVTRCGPDQDRAEISQFWWVMMGKYLVRVGWHLARGGLWNWQKPARVLCACPRQRGWMERKRRTRRMADALHSLSWVAGACPSQMIRTLAWVVIIWGEKYHLYDLHENRSRRLSFIIDNYPI